MDQLRTIEYVLPEGSLQYLDMGENWYAYSTIFDILLDVSQQLSRINQIDKLYFMLLPLYTSEYDTLMPLEDLNERPGELDVLVNVHLGSSDDTVDTILIWSDILETRLKRSEDKVTLMEVVAVRKSLEKLSHPIELKEVHQVVYNTIKIVKLESLIRSGVRGKTPRFEAPRPISGNVILSTILPNAEQIEVRGYTLTGTESTSEIIVNVAEYLAKRTSGTALYFLLLPPRNKQSIILIDLPVMDTPNSSSRFHIGVPNEQPREILQWIDSLIGELKGHVDTRKQLLIARGMIQELNPNFKSNKLFAILSKIALCTVGIFEYNN